ncbi:ABC transporter ATP-binding protein [Azospirillum argentinense]|uniref:ABC transporter ATP-binding protein n=1 Tax=Azospirillum argentinense TaxID=2970906 RepID=UPI0019145DC2
MAQPQLKVVGSAETARLSQKTLIQIDGVTKTYRTRDGEVPSLRPITFDVRDGEFLVVVGPSGCGKSTLLKLVAGLLPVSEGAITIEGTTVTEPHDDVGIVFQSPVLLAWRTVLRNIMMPVEVRGLPRDKYLERARALIRMTGLEGFENKYPWQLSGGMQQRASLCRALVHDPKILLMDEPFGALDAMTREKMNVELQRIQHETGKTVLLITHSIPEAVFLADRVMVMSERPGTIAATYEVPLPRPRSLDVMGHPVFIELTQRIRAHFNAQGHLD